jgi:hypothetical protein
MRPWVAFFFGAVHSQVKWPERPQLKQVWPEVVPVVSGAAGASQAGVKVEP